MKSSALASGSPRHILLPWPNGAKYSGFVNLPFSLINLQIICNVNRMFMTDCQEHENKLVEYLLGLNNSGFSHKSGSIKNFFRFDCTKQAFGNTWPKNI